MEPLKPMQPMDFGPSWWPENLGRPAASGGQDDVRYDFFPDARRLAIQRDGVVTLYDSGDHRVGGVSQRQGGAGSLTFASQTGEVRLEDLKKLSGP